MRDLITGATSCPDPSASSSSQNPLGSLANALLGSSSKNQVLTHIQFNSTSISFIINLIV